MMKPSVFQTPRRAPSAVSHGGRSKETPPPPKHQPKLVPKCLSSDFSALPEEILTESHDLVESSPEAISTVENSPETPISPPLRPPLPKVDEHGSEGSLEITVKKAAEEEVKAEADVVDRLREALFEMRKSSDVSSDSKRLLGALVEVAIGDVGGDPWAEDGRLDSAFWAKVRIGIVCFLILLAALMNLLAGSAVLIAGGGRDPSGRPPPT